MLSRLPISIVTRDFLSATTSVLRSWNVVSI